MMLYAASYSLSLCFHRLRSRHWQFGCVSPFFHARYKVAFLLLECSLYHLVFVTSSRVITRHELRAFSQSNRMLGGETQVSTTTSVLLSQVFPRRQPRLIATKDAMLYESTLDMLGLRGSYTTCYWTCCSWRRYAWRRCARWWLLDMSLDDAMFDDATQHPAPLKPPLAMPASTEYRSG